LPRLHHVWNLIQAIEVAGIEMTSTQLISTAAVAAVLSIAAVAERKALKRYKVLKSTHS